MQGVSPKAMWPLITMLGSRALQLYTTSNVQRAYIERAMQNLIYERTMASQGAVMTTLIDEMARQRTRELLVAYCILATAGKALTPAELDSRCEQFLSTQFGLSLDFTTEDALPALQEWGMVEAEGGKVVALPLQQALLSLDNAWDKLYAFVRPPPTPRPAPAPQKEGAAAAGLSAVREGVAGTPLSPGTEAKRRKSLISRIFG